MTRAERYAQAKALRDQGLCFREIGERLGISLSYAQDLIADPDGSAARERKLKQYGVCPDCGGPVSYRTGGVAERCRACHDIAKIIWDRDSVLDAIHRFAERYGRPPTACDFNPPLAIAKGRPEYAETFHRDGDYPHTSSATTVFGSWNAAIEAAGFTPKPSGAGGRRYAGDDPAKVEEGVQLYVAGMSYAEAAEASGVSWKPIWNRCRERGVGRDPAAAMRNMHQRKVAA